MLKYPRMTQLVADARLFAIAAHEAVGQRRRYTHEPYWHHCGDVAQLLRQHINPSWIADNLPLFNRMQAAAWLHDVVEDTHVELSTINGIFGHEVAELVEQLTDVSKPEDGLRAERKRLDRMHTVKASPAAKTIKLADLVSNTRSIVQHDPRFAEIYLAEKRLLLLCLREGDPVLFKLASENVV